MTDTLIPYEDWLRNDNGVQTLGKNPCEAFDRELVEQIKHNFVGFTNMPVGLYRGATYTVMTRKARSIAEINEYLPQEMGHKILRGIHENWVRQAGAPGQQVLANYTVRYAVIPLVKLHLTSPSKLLEYVG